MTNPLRYDNGRPKEMEEVEIVYLILGYMKYSEDDDDMKVWEIIDGENSRKDLYEWLKENVRYLDLEETRIYKSMGNKDLEYMINLTTPTAADEALRYFQSIFRDGFDIDEEIEFNVY